MARTRKRVRATVEPQPGGAALAPPVGVSRFPRYEPRRVPRAVTEGRSGEGGMVSREKTGSGERMIDLYEVIRRHREEVAWVKIVWPESCRRAARGPPALATRH